MRKGHPLWKDGAHDARARFRWLPGDLQGAAGLAPPGDGELHVHLAVGLACSLALLGLASVIQADCGVTCLSRRSRPENRLQREHACLREAGRVPPGRCLPGSLPGETWRAEPCPAAPRPSGASSAPFPGRPVLPPACPQCFGLRGRLSRFFSMSHGRRRGHSQVAERWSSSERPEEDAASSWYPASRSKNCFSW